MFWFIVISIVVIVLFRFFRAAQRDMYDLELQSLPHKFALVVCALNESAFKLQGEIIPLNERSFQLYCEGANQLITFHYGTGHLTIIWRYKYFQKEVVHKRQFRNVRNLSIFEQQKIARTMINEMIGIVEEHSLNVLRNIS